MNVYTITLERISTGERSPSLLFRGESEEAAREYAEGVIVVAAARGDLKVVGIVGRHPDEMKALRAKTKREAAALRQAAAPDPELLNKPCTI